MNFYTQNHNIDKNTIESTVEKENEIKSEQSLNSNQYFDKSQISMEEAKNSRQVKKPLGGFGFGRRFTDLLKSKKEAMQNKDSSIISNKKSFSLF